MFVILRTPLILIVPLWLFFLLHSAFVFDGEFC